MYGHAVALSGTCGVKVIYSLSKNYYTDYDAYSKPTESNLKRSAGWVIIGFVKTQECKTAYDYYTNKYEVVYQSPVRTNRNSGRKFFFIILDTSKLKDTN